MIEVYNRVAGWNSLRYEREYNHKLLLELLNEEYQEYLDAKTEVDEIDALGDIVYVALGGLWKLNISNEDLQMSSDIANDLLKDFINETPIDPIYLAKGWLDFLLANDDIQDSAIGLQAVCQLCLTQMSGYRLDFDQCKACLLVICDANDSKSIKKTASDTKANTDKGPYFVPPEARLQAILDTREVTH